MNIGERLQPKLHLGLARVRSDVLLLSSPLRLCEYSLHLVLRWNVLVHAGGDVLVLAQAKGGAPLVLLGVLGLEVLSLLGLEQRMLLSLVLWLRHMELVAAELG